MKNVTPSPGQVWEHKKTNMSCILNEVSIDYTDPVSLHKHFTFQPQTDLEWLAVSVNFSGMKSNEYARRNTYNKYSIEFWHYREEGCHSYEEIQNMRYELGLDEKPQKETTMIDLSKAKVGDEFVDGVGCKFKLMVIGKNDAVLSGYNCNGELYHYTSNFDGRFSDDDTILVSKHDPRHWLKDLPDADLFKLYQTSDIVCNQFGVWVANSLGAPTLTLCGNMMPKLKGDEWKLSKISIPDLKAWQEQQVK